MKELEALKTPVDKNAEDKNDVAFLPDEMGNFLNKIVK